MSQADVVRQYIIMSQDGETISSADLAAILPHSIESIHKFLHSPKVSRYLVEKHNLLPPPKHKSARTLSDKQNTWLSIITDPYSTRSLPTMVAKANDDDVIRDMSMAQHRRWMKQPAFLAEYKRRLAQDLKGAEGEGIRRQATKMVMGDTKALEMYYRLKGEPLPNALAAGTSGGVPIDLIMQILQKICTSEQLTQFAMLITNPEAQLQLSPPSPADIEDDDINVTLTEGPQPGVDK